MNISEGNLFDITAHDKPRWAVPILSLLCFLHVADCSKRRVGLRFSRPLVYSADRRFI